MNYYEILGVAETATQDDIKQAYRKLAMKNHPDRGGDTTEFQRIAQAYEVLGDPNKRAEYDNRSNGPQFSFNGMNPNEMNFGPFGDLGDIFRFTFGQGFNPRQHVRRNRDLTIRIAVSLKQSYTGTQIEAKFNLPSGKPQTVVVDIPAGIATGQIVRFDQLGDDSVPNVPRGNLNVQVIVQDDHEYERIDNDLCTNITINPLEAMLGCAKPVRCFDTELSPLKLNPGVQPGAEFRTSGRGFRDLRTGIPGDFIIKVKVEIPAVTDTAIANKLKELYAEINNTSK